MKYLTRRRLGGPAGSWERGLDEYRRRFAEIEPRLPENVRSLVAWIKRRPFHDEVVTSVERPDARTVRVFVGACRLEFFGVTAADLPELNEEEAWLYEEFDLTDSGLFVLRVLLEDGELSVTCRDVRLYSMQEGRSLVPEEPRPPGPTLFADRKGRSRRKRS